MPGDQWRPAAGTVHPSLLHPERVPVAVESRTAADGTATPLAIEWADGRRWAVEVEWAEPWGRPTAGGAGVQRWRYRVRLTPGGQCKYLWWDVPGRHVEVVRSKDTVDLERPKK